jgi:peptidoglycan/xylan/chitin deacetylase (PgdA/CDA1 family)
MPAAAPPEPSCPPPAPAGPALVRRDWVPTPLVGVSMALHATGAVALALAPQSWPWVLGGLAADHAVMGLAGMLPGCALLGPNLARLPEAAARRGEVALTFDDGPDPEVTPRVLDLLDAAGARASFFLIGARATRHAPLVREILQRGHSVENHTETHPLLFAMFGRGAQRREILQAQASICEAGGAPRFFRPPAGVRSPLLDPVLAETGLHQVSWTRRGADGLVGDPARVLRRFRGTVAGDVLLLHDADCRRDASGRPVVLAVLPALLAQLRAAGLSAVSLPAALGVPVLAGSTAPGSTAAAPAAVAAAAGSPLAA